MAKVSSSKRLKKYKERKLYLCYNEVIFGVAIIYRKTENLMVLHKMINHTAKNLKKNREAHEILNFTFPKEVFRFVTDEKLLFAEMRLKGWNHS